MKFIFLFPTVLCLSAVYGQNTQAPVKSASTELSPAVTNHSDPLEGETISHCESMIKAIDVKVAQVQSDPEQREKAIASAWFGKMAKNREHFVAAKAILEERKTTK